MAVTISTVLNTANYLNDALQLAEHPYQKCYLTNGANGSLILPQFYSAGQVLILPEFQADGETAIAPLSNAVKAKIRNQQMQPIKVIQKGNAVK